VQGLTEFIPVSSTGHLVLVRDLLGIQVPEGLAFDAVLQIATAIAAIIYFHKDIQKILSSALSFVSGKAVEDSEKTMLVALVVGTIPAVVAGLLLEDYMSTTFRSASFVALGLVAGSVVFWLAEKYGSAVGKLTIPKGLLVGFFQCLALVPGMSRSGSTIAGGLIAGIDRQEAIRFSFLLSIPIILGSGAKKLFDLFSAGSLDTLSGSLAVGMLSAFIFGLAAIHFLVTYLRYNTLKAFIVYRLILASVILCLSM
jgi:undecaprenyl-diphosphatase